MNVEVNLNLGLVFKGRPRDLDNFSEEIQKLADRMNVRTIYIKVTPFKLWVEEDTEPTKHLGGEEHQDVGNPEEITDEGME